MLQLTSTLHTEKSTEKEKTGTNAHRSIRSDNHGFIGFLGGLAVVMLSLGAAAAIAKGLIAIDVLPTSDAAPFIFYLGAAFAVSCFAAGAIFD